MATSVQLEGSKKSEIFDRYFPPGSKKPPSSENVTFGNWTPGNHCCHHVSHCCSAHTPPTHHEPAVLDAVSSLKHELSSLNLKLDNLLESANKTNNPPATSISHGPTSEYPNPPLGSTLGEQIHVEADIHHHVDHDHSSDSHPQDLSTLELDPNTSVTSFDAEMDETELECLNCE